MQRFQPGFWAILILCLTIALPAFADVKALEPPLMGDMFRMRVFDKPKDLPETVLTTVGGMQVPLSSYKGKLVLLNIWATWCPPCIAEMPSLNALQYSMDPKTFQVVNVSLDTTGPDAVKEYLTQHNLMTLLPYVDGNHQIQGLEILDKAPGIPISIFVDPQMRALAVFQGDTDWNSKDARAVIDYYAKNVSYVPFTINKF